MTRGEDHREVVGQFGGLEEPLEVEQRQAERNPSVSERDGTAQRTGSASADPHRNARLYCVGLDDNVAEVVMRAVVDGVGTRERSTQRGEGVVGDATPAGEFCTECVELFSQAAHAESQHEAAVADQIEGAVPLGDLEGMVIAEDQHLGGEFDPRRVRRNETEGGERVPVGTSAFGGDVDGDSDMLAAREVVVAESIGRLGDTDQLCGPGVTLPCGCGGRVLDDDG